MSAESVYPWIQISLLAASITAALVEAWIWRRIKNKWQALPLENREGSIPEVLHRLHRISAAHDCFQFFLIISMSVSVGAIFRSPMGIGLIVGIVIVPILASINCSLIEKEIRGATASLGAYFQAAFLGLSLCASGYLFIYGAHYVLGKAGDFISSISPWAPLFPGPTSIAFGIFKTFVGMALLYAAYPWILRFAYQLKDPENDEHLTAIKESLGKAGFSDPRVWYMAYDKMKHYNAMIYSHPFLGHYGRPTVLISKALVQKLTHEELEAVLFHEAAHHRLKHITKRILSLFCVLGALVFVRIWLFSLVFLFPSAFSFVLLIPSFVILDFVVPLLLVSRVVRVQELQADSYAVYRLGAKPEAMVNALQKLYGMNHMLANKRDPKSYFNIAGAHPTLEFRIQSIRQLEKRLARGEEIFQWRDYLTGSLESKSVSAPVKAAFVSLAGLAVVGAWMGQEAKQRLRAGIAGVDYRFEEQRAGAYGINASSPEVKAWLTAFETKNKQDTETLASDPELVKVFRNPEWGKFVFFSATDSSPEILEVVLEKADVPQEFLEHAVPRLRSNKNKVSLRLVQKHLDRMSTKGRGVASVPGVGGEK